jgi:RNA polymerase sigma factor (sigma-70 family)
VFTTAFNLLRSWRRRLRVARRHAALLTVAPDDPDAAAGLTVQRAVALLPDRQREAIALRYYADLSVRDTAAVMGCAEGTVRALTSQAISGLKTSLGREINLTDEEADL